MAFHGGIFTKAVVRLRDTISNRSIQVGGCGTLSAPSGLLVVLSSQPPKLLRQVWWSTRNLGDLHWANLMGVCLAACRLSARFCPVPASTRWFVRISAGMSGSSSGAIFVLVRSALSLVRHLTASRQTPACAHSARQRWRRRKR